MKNKYLKAIQVAALAAFALATLPSAQAVPTLRITVTTAALAPGATDTVITDENVPITPPGVAGTDLNAGPGPIGDGGVIFSGTIGNWVLVVSTGTTKPLNGSATAAEMHLNVSGTSTSGVTETLNVRFSEDFFGPISGGTFRLDNSATVDVPGGAGNNVTASAFFSSTNTQFAGVLLDATPASFGPGASADNFVTGPQTAASYSLTQQIVITHTAGAGRSTSAAQDLVQSVPDGGFTLSLLGGAMVGLAALRRKLFAA